MRRHSHDSRISRLASDAETHADRDSSPDPTRRARTAEALSRAGRLRGAQRDAVLDEVIDLNMGVARTVARRYRGRGIPLDDLQQVAYVGLVKAVRAFDPTRGRDFLTFATPTIRGEVRRHFRDCGWVVRPPRAVQEAQASITDGEGELHQSLGRTPTRSEVAEHLGVDDQLVEDAMAARGCFAPTSLDTSTEPGDAALLHRLGETDPGFARAEARVALREVVRRLSRRERHLLELRFFRGCSQAEIGRELGLSQAQVSRLLSDLFARLRGQLGPVAA